MSLISRKGCSSDNARRGFFGRPKVEFFYGRDWNGVALVEFADMLTHISDGIGTSGRKATWATRAPLGIGVF